MEVFITEKEEVSENYIGKHFEYGQLSNYIASSQSSTVALIFNTDWKSLEKHDKKIRNQVIDELLDWCLLQVKDDSTSTEKAITYSYFTDKLTEMRGGNNER